MNFLNCGRCDSRCFTHVESHISYSNEPFEYESEGIKHVHDINVRVTTWRCQNNHTFETRGQVTCVGCVLQRQKDIEDEIARQQSSESLRRGVDNVRRLANTHDFVF